MEEETISPELTEFSPWLREVLSDSEGLSNWGIDPGMAALLICSTFLILRGLSILKTFTDIAAEDIRENKEIDRMERRAKVKRRLRKEHGDKVMDEIAAEDDESDLF